MTITAAFIVAVMAYSQDPFTHDPSFYTTITTPVSGLGPNISSILPLEDSSLIISGDFRFIGDPNQNRRGARLFPNGARDPDFPYNTSMNGKISRWNDRYLCGMKRFFFDGTADPDFLPLYMNPEFSPMQEYDHHMFGDGSLVIGGYHMLLDTAHGFTGPHNFIWFTNTGHLDTTKVHRSGNGSISMIKHLPDGKFICSGFTTMQDGIPVSKVFRMNSDGSVDTTFNAPINWGRAWSCTPLADGKMIVSGFFKLNDAPDDTLHILRLMPSGEIDPTFNNDLEIYWPFAGQFLPLLHTRLESGAIVLHGSFTLVEGEPRGGIAILNETGYLSDYAFTEEGCGTFTFNDFPYGATQGMVEGYDGMWYIYGSYIGYDGNGQQRFVTRLYPPDLSIGLQELKGEKPAIIIYPNPATDHIKIDLGSLINFGDHFIQITDIYGRSALHIRCPNRTQILDVDITSLPSGIYTVQLTAADVILGSAKLALK